MTTDWAIRLGAKTSWVESKGGWFKKWGAGWSNGMPGGIRGQLTWTLLRFPLFSTPAHFVRCV